ncbi:lytic polysaccharide monooxygenase [Nocardia huaxiensis]|uniref:Lytic polysaccharide monooxygenase n=2 Tax=Nocardia huaxiensis TaxID=2755382 RepID=A0A7D6VQ43_9NOCA|nr:lytic polysaccharide monooxygenase [Nocardia huaxiensis]
MPGDARAHGYVDSPASRQAQCAQGLVACGEIKYEPQSVEGPKGLRSCSGGVGRFAELDDDSKGWRVQNVGRTVTFSWKFTAQHRTQNWEYYIGGTRVGMVEGNNQPPSQSASHTIDLGGFTGRQKLLAIWNIGDTANAFYSCLDLNISGDGGPTTPPATTTNPPTTNPPATTTHQHTTTPPTTEPPVTTTPPPVTTTTRPAPAGEWKVQAQYAIGDVVTYQGSRYRCRQAHTVHDPNWTPPATPALWERL